MAVSTITIAALGYPKGGDFTFRRQILTGTFTLTPGTYPVGGYVLNWGALEAIKSQPFPGANPSSTGTIQPIDVDVKSVSNPPSGVVYQWDNVVGNLHIFISNNGVSSNSGPLIELGGNLPGWVFNDSIQFSAQFWKVM